jgi:hypothetical protein
VSLAHVTAEIEHIEAEAWAQLHLALPAALRSQLRCQVKRHGAALSVRTPGADAPSGNRTVGLGFDNELTERQLSEIIAWYAAASIRRWLLEWSPEARPRAAETWFADRGGRAMTPTLKLWRTLGNRSPAGEQTTLAVVEIEGADAQTFEDTVAEPLGVPPIMAPVVRSTVGHEAWHFYLVRDGARPIAGAAMFVQGEGAWLGLSATIPADRGRGAQTALLARRFQDAAALGCAWVSADTQPETTARPNPSYRNMRRAGMDILYSRPKYLFETNHRP